MPHVPGGGHVRRPPGLPVRRPCDRPVRPSRPVFSNQTSVLRRPNAKRWRLPGASRLGPWRQRPTQRPLPPARRAQHRTQNCRGPRAHRRGPATEVATGKRLIQRWATMAQSWPQRRQWPLLRFPRLSTASAGHAALIRFRHVQPEQVLEALPQCGQGGSREARNAASCYLLPAWHRICLRVR
jgi:hypothetical protein